jgi:ATP-dependent Lhr-like helicase
VRGDSTPEPPSSPGAFATLEALKKRGALFFEDLALTTGLGRADLTRALWDVVGRGLVSPDGFQPLRDLMASGRKRSARPVHGRWALVEPALGVRLEDADRLADHVADQLLARYGVVFRGLFERESFTVPWREVLRALRRREARGLVRGGLFVTGVSGEQYALADAVDALRRSRRENGTDVTIRISATDPLNLAGIVTPGPRVPAHAGTWITYALHRTQISDAHVSEPAQLDPAQQD